MAQAGLSFVNDLAGATGQADLLVPVPAASVAAAHIADDQATFDTALANAYYVAGTGSVPSAGLEFTLATLAKNYDIHSATVFANALSNLAGANLSAIWSPWARLAAVQGQAHLTMVDIPAANAAFTERLAQAAADNAANLATGAADRTQWLADLAANSNQAIAVAQATLTSSNAGGDPSSVSAPGDLVPPANQDLGNIGNLSARSWFDPAPWSLSVMGWSGVATDNGFYSTAWGDPLSTWWGGSVGYYDWLSSGAYDGRLWGTAYGSLNWIGSVGYGWWSDAGMVAPISGVFDPFGGIGGLAHEFTGDYFAAGFAGLNYGLWFGAGFGYWYSNWGYYGGGFGYAWLPDYSGLSAPSASIEPTAAVQEVQTSVNTLSTLASAGKDLAEVLKNAAPVAIQVFSGLADVGAAAGFAGFAIATDGATGEGQSGPAPKPMPLTQSQLETLRKAADAETIDIKSSFKVDGNGLTDKEKLWLRLESGIDEFEGYARNEVAEANQAAARFAFFINESELDAAAVAANTSLTWTKRILKLKEIGRLLQYQFNRYADERARAYHYLKYLGPQDPLRVATRSLLPFLPGAEVFTAPDKTAEVVKQIKLHDIASEEDGKALKKLQGQLETTQSVVHRAQLVVGALLIAQGAIAAEAEKATEAAANRLINTMIAMKLIDVGMNAGADVARAFGASDNQVNTGLYWASFALLVVLPEEGAEEGSLAGKLGKPRGSIADNPNNIQLKLFAEEDAALKARAVEEQPVATRIAEEPSGPKEPPTPAQPPVSQVPKGLPASVPKNNLHGTPLEGGVLKIQKTLMEIRDTAVQNVRSGKGVAANEPWATRLKGMSPSDAAYPRTFGSAVHEEAFELIKAEKAAGRLPKDLVTNTGVAQPKLDLPNNYNRKIPDIRLSLGNGKEAVWDITTKTEAGALEAHVDPYAKASFVEYAADLPYER